MNRVGLEDFGSWGGRPGYPAPEPALPMKEIENGMYFTLFVSRK